MPTEHLSPSELRPPRRHARVRCTVTLDNLAATGFTSNLSPTGAYVRVPGSELGDRAVVAGDRVRLELQLEGEAAAVDAEVVWSNLRDTDIGGRPVVGLGLRLLDPAEAIREQLEAFVREFRYTVLVVSCRLGMRTWLADALGEYRVLQCSSVAAALTLLRREDVGVLISDDELADATVSELFGRLVVELPHGHFVRIVLSSHPQAADLQALINVGRVFHVLHKPLSKGDLLQVVRRGVDAYAMSVENERLNAELERAIRQLKHENAELRRRVEGTVGFEQILGSSPALRRALADLRRIQRTDITVHLRGETGTGKELAARALHSGGPRAQGPFVAQNCAGIAETLLQSTLFGHVRGAFTGAHRDQLGVFQQASGGTLFLDEVAELSPSMQAALLRALQDGEVMRVGASRPEKVDVRVISATHRDLREETREGRFRQDLYFRLVVIDVQLPPLRERRGDVALLARHLLQLSCRRHGRDLVDLDPQAWLAMQRYPWPGNVRELANEIERLVVLAGDDRVVGAGLLSPHIRALAPGEVAAASYDVISVSAADVQAVSEFGGRSYDEAVQALEREMISWALDQSGGVVSKAARLLQMDRSRLSKLRQRLGVVDGSK